MWRSVVGATLRDIQHLLLQMRAILNKDGMSVNAIEKNSHCYNSCDIVLGCGW